MTVTPGQLVIESGKLTATTIFITWSVPSGFVTEQHKVEWFSHQCPGNQTEGNAIISGVATNFTIPELRAGTEYKISVTAINPPGNFTSNVLTIPTLEMGECNCRHCTVCAFHHDSMSMLFRKCFVTVICLHAP